MKLNILTSLFLANTLLTTTSSGQVFLNWNTLTDTNGFALGQTTSGQVFDLGAGRNITATWSGSFSNGAPQGYSFFDALNGVELRGDQGASLSVTFSTNFSDVWTLESQRNNTGIDTRDGVGTVTADGVWTVFAQNGLTDLTGNGTNVLEYNSQFSGGAGDFDASFTGTTFTYDYSVQTGFPAPTVHDSFRFALNSIPEPSSALLLGLGAFGLLGRRKR